MIQLSKTDNLVVQVSLQQFSSGWNIGTAMGEPANNIIGRHRSESSRERLV